MGTHRVHQFTDSHVRAFEIRREVCHFLPQRIKNFFPNIEVLQVQNSKLQALTQADLKPLTKLRVLLINANQLTSLENKLFSFNPELVKIEFKHQKLRLVGYNILDGLNKLALADFQSSGCISFYAQNGKQGIDELKKEIRINCQPIDELIDEGNSLKERIEMLESGLGSKGKLVQCDCEGGSSQKLDAKFLKLQQENEKCRENVGMVQTIFFTLMEKVDSLERILKAQILKELNDPSSEHCTALEIENQQCMTEYQRITRETSGINIECEEVDWKTSAPAAVHSCNAKNLKVSHRDVEVKNVLDGNRMQALDAQRVEELKVFNEQVLFIPHKLAERLPGLKALIINDCELLEINGKALKGLKKLQSLVASNNQISSVPTKSFDDLTTLTLLDISSNKIREIEADAFSELLNLVQLKLNDNKLVELPLNMLAKQQKLKFLFLQNNQLMVIPDKLLESLTKLEFADLTKNKCIDIEASKTSTILIGDLEAFFTDNCSSANRLAK